MWLTRASNSKNSFQIVTFNDMKITCHGTLPTQHLLPMLTEIDSTKCVPKIDFDSLRKTFRYNYVSTSRLWKAASLCNRTLNYLQTPQGSEVACEVYLALASVTWYTLYIHEILCSWETKSSTMSPCVWRHYSRLYIDVGVQQ